METIVQLSVNPPLTLRVLKPTSDVETDPAWYCLSDLSKPLSIRANNIVRALRQNQDWIKRKPLHSVQQHLRGVGRGKRRKAKEEAAVGGHHHASEAGSGSSGSPGGGGGRSKRTLIWVKWSVLVDVMLRRSSTEEGKMLQGTMLRILQERMLVEAPDPRNSSNNGNTAAPTSPHATSLSTSTLAHTPAFSSPPLPSHAPLHNASPPAVLCALAHGHNVALLQRDL